MSEAFKRASLNLLAAVAAMVALPFIAIAGLATRDLITWAMYGTYQYHQPKVLFLYGAFGGSMLLLGAIAARQEARMV